MFSPIQQVTGSTLGIIGFGNIGKAVAEKAKGFNMKILYYSRTRKEDQEKFLGKVQAWVKSVKCDHHMNRMFSQEEQEQMLFIQAFHKSLMGI